MAHPFLILIVIRFTDTSECSTYDTNTLTLLLHLLKRQRQVCFDFSIDFCCSFSNRIQFIFRFSKHRRGVQAVPTNPNVQYSDQPNE